MKPQRKRAFMTMDALAGLFLLAALATALVVAAHAQQRAAHNLADQRRALAAAQSAIQNLSVNAPIDDKQASVSRTGLRVGEKEWVEVTGICNGRRVSLTFLASTVQGSK
jgi:Tfp pilus assembly protein PilX